MATPTTADDMLHMLKKGNIKQTKASSNALHKENIAVEKKLSALKEKMKKEKDERERMGGPRWKSSQKMNKTSDKQKAPRKNLKILSDQPLDHYKPERKPPATDSLKLCGQCDERKAKVECNECAESYCADCYKHFHSRGALRKHTWKSLDQSKLKARLKQQMENINSKSAPAKRDVGSMQSPIKSDSVAMTNDFSKTKEMISVNGYSVPAILPRAQPLPNLKATEIQNDEKRCNSVSKETSVYASQATREITSPSRRDAPNQPSLLRGEYNEEESAALFSQALNEWRRAGVKYSPKTSERGGSATSTQGTCVTTDRASSHGNNGVKVEFSGSPSLSYLDRIIVKKHKKNPQVLITAKYASKKQDPSNSTRSPKSGSPLQNITNENSPSPCVLSVHCSSPAKILTKSSVIEIHPYNNEDGERSLMETTTSPIISYDGSDIDIKLNCSPSPTSDISAVDLVHGPPSWEHSPVSNPTEKAYPSSSTNNYEYQISLPHIVSNAKKTDDNNNNANITHMYQMDWKQPPLYVNMGNYFLLGNNVETNNTVSKDGVVIPNSVIQGDIPNDLCLNYENVWRPDSSILQVNISKARIPSSSTRDIIDIVTERNLQPYIQTSHPHNQNSASSGFPCHNYLLDSLDMSESNVVDDKVENHIPEPTITAPSPQSSSLLRTRDATFGDYLNDDSDDDKIFDVPAVRSMTPSPKSNLTYDFIQALPPLSKGDNYDKIHRSSTSLSISALPIDIWADSDISLPVSRRSSNLCSSVTVSRKVSSNFETLTEQHGESHDVITTNLNFSKLNLLADEVIARRSEGSANSADDCDEKVCSSAGGNTLKCDTDRHYDVDNMSIEDNDAGSGLTTSDESGD